MVTLTSSVEARLSLILEELERRDQVTVNDLSHLLGVSEVTIRSDLARLRTTRQIFRTRGGASKPFTAPREKPVEEASSEREGEKRRIGACAASLVRSGETILLDVGSTTTELARALSNKLQNVTVVTNGLNIALALEHLPNVTVIVTGGTLRPLQHSLVNPLGEQVLSSLRADRAFIGCNGVSLEHGVTNLNLPETEIKRRMVECASEVIVLADHSKLEHISTARVVPLNCIHRLITDQAADKKLIKRFRAAGLTVDLA